MRGPAIHDENRSDLRNVRGKTGKPRKPVDENRTGAVSGKPQASKPQASKDTKEAAAAKRPPVGRARSALTSLPTQTQSAPPTGTRAGGRVPGGGANVGRLPRLKSSTAGATASARHPSAAPLRPREPRTPPRRAAAPKTPAEQVGAAGAVRAALLAKRRPVAVPDTAPRRPKPARSISVLPDEPGAGPSAIDAPYAPLPPPAHSAKAAAALADLFPPDHEHGVPEPSPIDVDFDLALPDIDEPPSPPSPRFGAFGGDDFQFDLV